MPIMAMAGIGRFAGLVWPQGLVFWVFDYSR